MTRLERAAQIERIVAAAPELTETQAARIAVLLRPTSGALAA